MVHFRNDGSGSGVVVSENFAVTYDGPALAEHRMDVQELAPALLALGEMFVTAHRIIDEGYNPPPALQVRANPREGSFAVDLLLSMGNEAVDLLSSPGVVASATATGLVANVVGALRWMRASFHRSDDELEEVTEVEPGTIEVSWADGETIRAPLGAMALIESMDFRRSARTAFEPVTRTGIDSIEIAPESRPGEPEGDAIKVTRNEWAALDKIPGDERLVAETDRTAALRPIKPDFRPGYKWRMTDGGPPFWATIHDLQFLQRVASNEEFFSAGDLLYCQLRERQYEEADGSLRWDRTVMRVIRHLHNPPPDPLPIDAE